MIHKCKYYVDRLKRQTTILRLSDQMTNLRLEPTFEPIHLPHATYGPHPSEFT